MVLEASVVTSERSPNVTQRTNMEITSLYPPAEAVHRASAT